MGATAGKDSTSWAQGGWGRALQNRAEGLGFCAHHGMEDREKRVEDKLRPVHSGQDGADKTWAMPEKARALAPGHTPPCIGFIILISCPKALGFGP